MLVDAINRYKLNYLFGEQDLSPYRIKAENAKMHMRKIELEMIRCKVSPLFKIISREVSEDYLTPVGFITTSQSSKEGIQNFINSPIMDMYNPLILSFFGRKGEEIIDIEKEKGWSYYEDMVEEVGEDAKLEGLVVEALIPHSEVPIQISLTTLEAVFTKRDAIKYHLLTRSLVLFK